MSLHRDQLKEQYGTLYSVVESILFTHDPAGVNFGDNTDEYAPEVDTILPRLKAAKKHEDVALIVYEEILKWFDPSIAGDQSAPIYSAIANDIWPKWLEFTTD
ncbi:MAG: hypothetical protein P8H39_06295 [Thalassotalea sp.]|nr:hypothetical protein [Thalassotalea sp.]